MSSILNWKDRNTCVLFGDGAGAAVIRHKRGSKGIVASDLGSDGSQAQLLAVKNSGCVTGSHGDDALDYPFVAMAGKEVYRHAVTRMGASAVKTLAAAGWNQKDLALVVPHQANVRIIEALSDKLSVPMEKIFVNLNRYGNTSAACIPIGLHEASQSGRIERGDKVLLVAFGGGFTWASVALEW
jgi:3-oxoacyl-[acyl-carrier-protein] synthase-3